MTKRRKNKSNKSFKRKQIRKTNKKYRKTNKKYRKINKKYRKTNKKYRKTNKKMKGGGFLTLGDRHNSNIVTRQEEWDNKCGENAVSDDDKKCVVCFVNDVSDISMICGHHSCCMDCYNQIVICPMCREEINNGDIQMTPGGWNLLGDLEGGEEAWVDVEYLDRKRQNQFIRTIYANPQGGIIDLRDPSHEMTPYVWVWGDKIKRENYGMNKRLENGDLLGDSKPSETYIESAHKFVEDFRTMDVGEKINKKIIGIPLIVQHSTTTTNMRIIRIVNHIYDRLGTRRSDTNYLKHDLEDY